MRLRSAAIGDVRRRFAAFRGAGLVAAVGRQAGIGVVEIACAGAGGECEKAHERACRCGGGGGWDSGGRRWWWTRRRRDGVAKGEGDVVRCGGAMATAEIWRTRESCLMEESSGCEIGAGSLRRRRMEIRRIKMLSSANVFVEQPVSKRLRPVSGVSNVVPRLEVDAEGGTDEALCETNRGNALSGSSTCSDECGKEKNSANWLSVCGVIREPGQAASSLSTAWGRPSGDVRKPGEENDCASNASDIVGKNSSDRMSSEGSGEGSAQHIEDSDVSSTVTSVGGELQSTLGNELVATTTKEPSQAGSRGSRAQESRTTGPDSADMSSTASDTVTTIDHVDNQQHIDTLGAHPQWQGSGNDTVPDSSAVTAGDAGGSSAPGNCFASNACPSHGMVSLCGRRREMEDAVVSKDSFVKLPCQHVGGCDAAGSDAVPLHYFGVYDGHGGSQAANFCAERLHQTLAEEVESCLVQGHNVDQNVGDWESKWLTAMTQCFKRMDAEVGGFCVDEGECPAGDNPRCCPEPIAPETVGTTAIVAVVGACQIIIGNCGDSRAVLSRGGVAIPLSVDHKPEREDEMARVEAAGGRVIYWNGYRVLGVLAMSRAIGDRYLKPYIIADPEVKCIKRAEDDEFLILASDGLWDVMSNEVVCDIARKALNCRRTGQPTTDITGTTSDDDPPAAQAAALLVKLALAKGSSDNISVVVVDLKKVPRDR